MKTDIEISRECTMLPISEVAAKLGITDDELETYGKYKAKLSDNLFTRLKDKEDGKLVLVTAINPTPAGEGKTTVTVGLGQALCSMGKNAVIAIREPSLGPVFGIKGGAAGGGYAQVVPMEDINLHFTGDLHAVTAAHNLLAALLDNHLQQGNVLGINPKRVIWKRALDMNDRALRSIVIGLGGAADGVSRQDGFMITAASEIMAVLCLSEDVVDLKRRIGNIIVAYTYSGEPVTARDLKADGAMTVLLKDAINPNLVQTLENTPCIIHGGPFANIAHGCNTVRATKIAQKLGDYCITEAGFGADLGGEKFLDIKCRLANLKPQAIVIVATVRALKYNGGVDKTALKEENVAALEKGLPNLGKHIENMASTGIKPIVALNCFDTDTEAEFAAIEKYCENLGVKCVKCTVFAEGGKGGVQLANAIIEATETHIDYTPLYDTNKPVKEKINDIVTKVYGGAGVSFTADAEKAIADIERLGFGDMPVCIAKTQYSLSDNATRLGRPENFTVTIREVRVSAGAGFIVALAGAIMTMPGLPKTPAANSIDIDADNVITGLF